MWVLLSIVEFKKDDRMLLVHLIIFLDIEFFWLFFGAEFGSALLFQVGALPPIYFF